MKITDIRATTVTVPLEAPLRHANGCHWGRFVRTIVEVETDNGLIGLGEMGGGGESAEAVFRAMKAYLAGPRSRASRGNALPDREPDGVALQQPHTSPRRPRVRLPRHPWPSLERSRLRHPGRPPPRPCPVCVLLLFPLPQPANRPGRGPDLDQIIENARALKQRYGFTTHKMKAGVFHPDHEIELYRALAETFPKDKVRFDPNATWSTEQAIRFGQRIEDLNNDYLEDPVYGLNGMRRTREMVRVPLATNTVVVNFEQLAANILDTAVDVILLDTTFWGGIRQCVKAAGVCETFQLGVAVHSSGELGIQLASMLHLGAVVPNLSFAADAHYHHLIDDIIEGGLMPYEDGAIRVPDGPGLGVKLDRDKLLQYSELYKRLGGYAYDQDPSRPGWTPIIPNDRWADPKDDKCPKIPY